MSTLDTFAVMSASAYRQAGVTERTKEMMRHELLSKGCKPETEKFALNGPRDFYQVGEDGEQELVWEDGYEFTMTMEGP